MADTTALKNRIHAAIKANDNKEITGPVLQQSLLDIVDEIDLYPELENEAQQRQNGDTQLNNLITGIRNNLEDKTNYLADELNNSSSYSLPSTDKSTTIYVGNSGNYPNTTSATSWYSKLFDLTNIPHIKGTGVSHYDVTNKFPALVIYNSSDEVIYYLEASTVSQVMSFDMDVPVGGTKMN